MLTGHCNCSQVAFTIEAEPSDIYACHCSICRRSTGVNGVAVVVVRKTAFSWTRGEDLVQRWRKPDGDWGCAFCRVCGSALPDENDSEHLYVPVGVLDDTRQLRIAHHIWVDSRANWDELPSVGERHGAAFSK